MKVHKFGGASVRDAAGIRNLARIIATDPQPAIIVISALGKTTNRLEEILQLWDAADDLRFSRFEELRADHLRILEELQLSPELAGALFDLLMKSFEAVEKKLHKKAGSDYDKEYDQLVSKGELWSTRLVSACLNNAGIHNTWVDIRQGLLTDNLYRQANVDYPVSARRCKTLFSFSDTSLYITQGFVGVDPEGYTTTLGREGSDFTAAVLANILDARELCVWKDVPGILNADPAWMPEAMVLPALSYREVVELSFFGAKVIHPKTIKPLHNKNIPLYVKSFLKPEGAGTVIRQFEKDPELAPVFVKKENQILISLYPKDIGFALEDELVPLFGLFAAHKIHINLVQTSAITITVCADYEERRWDSFFPKLKEKYKVRFNQKVLLLSVRHYTKEAVRLLLGDREVLIEQGTRKTRRYVVRCED